MDREIVLLCSLSGISTWLPRIMRRINVLKAPKIAVGANCVHRSHGNQALFTEMFGDVLESLQVARGCIMSMPPMPIELVRVVQNGLYWQVAATTAVLYDHVTTLDLEVELVWRRKWTFVQVLFVVNRYLGDALFVHGATQAWFSGEILEAA
ncbi:hypothetical protein CC2G_003356 [Coprinopsis cinerea AmutBmut pab1-1]|nr:hypothetical protein CC2G_003356 [Coprinopsis cinerea AmutBmut pab1-1]